MAKLSGLLDQIDSETMLLPEFQRGYVWNRDQVRGLMRSLYLGYPVGGLLVWETETEGASVRGGGLTGTGVRLLLLDGQQRITSLYGVVRGKPPAFFEGNADAFTGLRFNVEDETFEFFAPAKMRDDPRWIDVTALYTRGLEAQISALNAHPDTQARIVPYMTRLAKLSGILEREFHAEKITGQDKSVDAVVDIFNRVNSGGTKLSKGDLALAKICAEWPDARAVMRGHLNRWEQAGFGFNLDWLLRNTTAVATGRSQFSTLTDVDVADFETALAASAGYVGHFLDTVSGRLGLDHDRVLMGRYAVPVVSRFLHLSRGTFSDATVQDRILYWYVQSALWGRFAGSTETVLNQDYETAGRAGVDGLITALERWRGGNLSIGGDDFVGAGIGSRFYPLLYLLTRVRGARDFDSGLELKRGMLGHLATLQVHHIFPKVVLYNAGYNRYQVNAVANFCFLTQKTNLAVGTRIPEDYFREAESRHPGVLTSQWIPQDPVLWKIDAYPDFLEARRELLASAANDFLSELRTGVTAATAVRLDRIDVVDVPEEPDGRAENIAALVEELRALGCAEPALDFEIVDPVSGRVLAMSEACWPDGLQTGQGNPVVLELDSVESDINGLAKLGYTVFTSVDALRAHARRRNAEAAGVSVAEMDELPEMDSAPSRDDDEGDVRAEFERAMRGVYERAKSEADYPASYYLRMLSELGGLETARNLLHKSSVSEGFTHLWERGRLDLTVEAAVLQPRFAALFTDEELDIARRRLADLGYRPSESP
jgi:hypothetical protein